MEYDEFEEPLDEADFSEWIDDQYRNWAIAMGFDENTDLLRWIETEMDDDGGDYCV